MNYFSSLLTAFCSACVIIGLLFLISPDGAMSKSVRYILGLVFLLSIVTATGLSVKTPQFDFTFEEETIQSSDDLDNANAEYIFKSALKNAGIEFSEITVCTDKLDNGRIVINKVIIRSDCERERILSVLGDTTGYEVEIINE